MYYSRKRKLSETNMSGMNLKEGFEPGTVLASSLSALRAKL
jgi:hypothetical protein